MELSFSVADAYGNVLRTGETMAVDFSAQAGPGEVVVQGIANEVTQWINPQTLQIENRELMEVEVSEQEIGNGKKVTITGMPPNAQVVVNEEDTIDMGNDTSLQLIFNTIGVYMIFIYAPGYLLFRAPPVEV